MSASFVASTIRIKRSASTAAPTTLANAELAYSENSSKLFIGVGTGGEGGSATSIIAIGGPGAYTTIDTTQTISGAKTFSGSVDLGSSAVATTKSPGNNSTAVATTAYVDAATAALDLSVTGDSGSVSIDHASESLGILGGTGLTSSAAGNAVTINLDNTTVTAGSYGSSSAIPTFTVDAQGRLTAAGTANVASTLTTAGDGGTAGSVSLLTQSLSILGGTGLTSSASNHEITISLDNSAQAALGLVIGTNVQAHDADLDTLSGMQAGAATALAALTSTEIQILDGATVTTAELNIVDGSTSATATTLALADRLVVNDGGIMVQVALSDLVAFLEDGSASGFDLDGGGF